MMGYAVANPSYNYWLVRDRSTTDEGLFRALCADLKTRKIFERREAPLKNLSGFGFEPKRCNQ
jgi:hypothetical protein